MSQQVIDYQSAPVAPPSGRRLFVAAGVVAAVVLVVNALLLVAANNDRSFGAMAIALMGGPVANLVVLAVALSLLPVLNRAATPRSKACYLAASIALPLVAAAVDFRVIMSMSLTGC